MNVPGAIEAFLFVLAAFVAGGVAQTLWFRTALSRRFLQPLDGGLRLGGRPVFGANKTVRGFLVIVPVVAAMFAGLAALLGEGRPWTLMTADYAWLGALGAFGFMAGELPNSFLKRRLGIGAGQPAKGVARVVFLVFDRVDSILGMLVALAVCVPVSIGTWLLFLTLGPAVHLGFSAWMWRVGIKARAA